jgi:hypothetical protein
MGLSHVLPMEQASTQLDWNFYQASDEHEDGDTLWRDTPRWWSGLGLRSRSHGSDEACALRQ